MNSNINKISDYLILKSNNYTILGCFKLFKNDISHKAVDGIPSFLFFKNIFFIATFYFNTTSFAL